MQAERLGLISESSFSDIGVTCKNSEEDTGSVQQSEI